MKFFTQWRGVAALLVMLLSMAFSVNGQATLTSDQADYPPGSTVILTGSGFQPFETVTVQVIDYSSDGDNETNPLHQPWEVTADSLGKFTTTWYVDEYELGMTLLATAIGQSSGLKAEVTFTDGTVKKVTIGTPSGTLTYGTPGSITYIISVESQVSGQQANSTTISLSASGLPADVSYTFSPASLVFTGNQVKTATLTITSTNLSRAINAGAFSVTGNDGGGTKTDNSTFTINKKALTGTVTVSNKPYDATTAATIASRNLNGVVSPDQVSLTGGTASFATANAGTGITVNVSGLAITGTDASNYTVNTSTTALANILKKDVTGSFTVAAKTYDGNNSATIATRSLSGKIGNDKVDLSDGTATFDDANAGTNKLVTGVGFTLTGNQAGNYNLNPATIQSTGNIDPRPVTASIVPVSREYDGSRDATISGSSIIGLLLNDANSVSLNFSAAAIQFDTKDVATDKTVTATGVTISSSNYSLSGNITGLASITPKALTGSFTAADKVYDGTVSATIVNTSLSGVIGLDKVSYSNGTATFDNKDAGLDKTVTGTGFVLTGADKNNYSVNASASTTADILPAKATIAITPYTGTYDGQAHTASGSATGVNGEDLTGSLSFASSYTDAPGGNTNWSFDGGINYRDSSNTTTVTINKAKATIAITPYTGTYDGQAHTASGTASGVNGEDLKTSLSFASSYTDAPGGSTNWSFDGGINYRDSSNTTMVTINKAKATIAITPYTGTYDGQAHTASGSATGVNGEDLTGSLSFASSYTDAPGGNTNWSFDGGINYRDSSNTTMVTINKAKATIAITPYTGTYDGQAHTASGTASGVNGEDLKTSLSFASSYTDAPGGSTNWSFDGGINYRDSSNTTIVTINKAKATIAITPYTGAYDGQAHTASGSATGVQGEDLTTSLSFASTYTDAPGGSTNWSFDGGINYRDSSNTTSVTINKAKATIAITPYAGTYDGQAHTASGSATGVQGEDLNASLSFASSYTDAPGGNTNWSFDGGINYRDSSNTTTVTINKAKATIAITPYTGTYDGQAHTASGSATGVQGEDLSTSLSFANSYTDAPGGNTNWSFDGGINYRDSSNTATVTINKAKATIAITPYTGTYDGQAHTASGTASGVNGEDLNASLSFASSYTDAPGGSTNWSFDGGINYRDSSNTTSVTINKAKATIAITPYAGTYDGQAHTASGSATGVNGEDLSASLSFANSYTDAPGGNTNWSFDGGINYRDSSNTTTVTINKAKATIAITPYTGTYDGQAHTASGSATGVNGEDLNASLSFASSYTDAPGGNTNWSFDGGINYRDSSNTTSVTINKAKATIAITPYTGTYDGQAHTASGSATGVQGEDLTTSLSFASSYTDAPGGNTNWSFDGGINYRDSSNTTTVTINKAKATIAITPYTGTYDGQAHTASGTASGVNGEDLNASLSFASSYTDAPGGNTNWSFDGGINYRDSSNTTSVTINKAKATIAITPYTGTYDGQAHTASGTATGVNGEDLTTSLSFASSYTDAPGGSTNWSFNGGINYLDSTNSTTVTINRKSITAMLTGSVLKVYNGNMSATLVATNYSLDGVVGTDDVYLNNPASGTYDTKQVATGKLVTVTGLALMGTKAGNYSLASTTASANIGIITPFRLKVSATGQNKVYDATTSATVSLSDNRIPNDVFTRSYASASFADKKAGTGKTVTVTGISISGTDAGNYTWNTDTTTTANITPYRLRISAIAQNKVYNGTKTATVTLTDDRKLNDVFTAAYTEANFNNENTGTNKTVTVTGISISGTDADNYTWNTDTTTTASITALETCGSYNGTLFANTDVMSNGTITTATTVKLSVVVTTTGSADARTASVKFTTDNNGGPYYGSLESSSTLNQAIYSVNMPVDIGNNLSKTIEVTWQIGGNFSGGANCPETNTNLTVSTRTSDFLTGGGFVELTNSAGTYMGNNNKSKANFGFNVKWNKSSTNIQGGGFNGIVRNGNKLYRIKGTKVSTLVVTARTSTNPATANFTSGNTTISVYDALTGALLSSVGNCNLTVEISDACEPGAGSKSSNDLIAITVKDSRGITLLYSNNWSSATAKTVKQSLAGGNIQIQSAANAPAPICGTTTLAPVTNPTTQVEMMDRPATVNKFSVKLAPNPSVNHFTLSVQSNLRETVHIRILDIRGRTIEMLKGAAGETFKIGQSLKGGTYFIEVIQGTNRSMTQVIKL